MWLAPALSFVSGLASRIYFKLSVEGEVVPARGPVLLVANHPNSLMDPILVAAAAGRRVRFLAKAPLFSDRKIGFLVRGSGAIPVYRRVDDPTAMAGNDDMFRAVFDALASGSAIALFPEGISHTSPSLAKLKTGAARIALGNAAGDGSSFPIIPVGLVFRRKDVFRSEALAVIGSAVEWADLAGRGQDDRDAVAELTARIETAIRKTTVNLGRWEDGPLVECAERIWAAEHSSAAAGERVKRIGRAAGLLARIRESGKENDLRLVRDVARHQKTLRQLGLAPADLSQEAGIGVAIRWSVGRIYLASLPAVALALVSYLLFWPPYRLTGGIVGRANADEDQVSTWKMMVGIPVYLLWIAAISVAATFALGPLTGTAAAIALPVAGMSGLWLRERWRSAWSAARRFFLIRSNAARIRELRKEQRELAGRLAELVERGG